MYDIAMDQEKEAAALICRALRSGGTLEGIATELGKMAVLYPCDVLPTYDPIFNAQVGLIMESAYRDGIVHIKRMS